MDKLIPVSSYKNLKIDIPLSVKVQNGKSVTGGQLVEYKGVVPFDLERDQIEMALLKAVKVTKDKHPDCEWIIVFLMPDERLEHFAFFSGRAEYKEGVLQLDLAAPSAENIKEWNDRLGPDDQDLKLASFSRDSFEKAVNLIQAFIPLEQDLQSKEKYVQRENAPPTIENYHSENDILKILVKRDGANYKEYRLLYSSIYSIYNAQGWGGKTIRLNVAGEREVKVHS
jgi:hypothetical protein